MNWYTLFTMIFAIGTVFGGLTIMLLIACFRKTSDDEPAN